jgi:hypothetical protein
MMALPWKSSPRMIRTWRIMMTLGEQVDALVKDYERLLTEKNERGGIEESVVRDYLEPVLETLEVEPDENRHIFDVMAIVATRCRLLIRELQELEEELDKTREKPIAAELRMEKMRKATEARVEQAREEGRSIERGRCLYLIDAAKGRQYHVSEARRLIHEDLQEDDYKLVRDVLNGIEQEIYSGI